MVKGALLLAVVGALCLVAFSCPVKPYYSCVHSHKPKHCTAIQVCEHPNKEPCGNYYCEYPYICASTKKSVCKDFYKLKEQCEYKKACKEVKIPCGSGACSVTHDCVKENHCYLKKIPHGRRLMGPSYGKGGSYGEKSGGHVSVVKPYKEVHVCEDKYSCVAKDPCRDIIIKKCVKDVLKPGIDYCHGGFDFYWYGGHAAEKCGSEYCGAGYKCAEVIIKKCVKSCGDSYCNYGEECVSYGKECEDYAYLAKICKDVYEPTCVPLSPYMKLHYKPPCKTVFKCEEEPSVCGGKYCPKGYTCEVSYKKSCGVVYKPTIIAKPIVIHTKPKAVFPFYGGAHAEAYAGSHYGGGGYPHGHAYAVAEAQAHSHHGGGGHPGGYSGSYARAEAGALAGGKGGESGAAAAAKVTSGQYGSHAAALSEAYTTKKKKGN